MAILLLRQVLFCAVLLTVLVVTTVDLFTTCYSLHATEDFLVSWGGRQARGKACLEGGGKTGVSTGRQAGGEREREGEAHEGDNNQGGGGKVGRAWAGYR